MAATAAVVPGTKTGPARPVITVSVPAALLRSRGSNHCWIATNAGSNSTIALPGPISSHHAAMTCQDAVLAANAAKPTATSRPPSPTIARMPCRSARRPTGTATAAPVSTDPENPVDSNPIENSAPAAWEVISTEVPYRMAPKLTPTLAASG